MILAAVSLVVGITVGYLRGGSLERLASTRLRVPWVILFAVLAQAAIAIDAVARHLPDSAVRGLLMASLIAVLTFVWCNRSLPVMWVILLGFALNAAVIIANGAMPVSPDAIAFLGADPDIDPGKHRLLTDSDHLPWLADTIPVPGLRVIVSIGDIVLAVGVGQLVNRLMQGPRGRHAAPHGVQP